ncbi:MAG: SDR family oxidoreductase [Anaerolineales bacterium]|nr:SDR family oxidoreductase [Anaerolineales bacterium]
MTAHRTRAQRPLRVLVTGGCGYLGSQVIRDLATQVSPTPHIRILDNLQTGSVRALMNLPEQGRYEFIEGDILDPATLRLALQEVDTVVHLAAIVRTPLSFENPVWMEQVNHWGTAHLAEACLAAGVQHLIFTSSTAVYGPGGPFTEEDVCRPQGAYAQSKLAAEQGLATTHRRGLRVTILRIGTLFGLAPVTRFDAVANRFAYLAGVGRPVTVYGEGAQRRPLLHVRDASAAIRHFIETPDEGESSLFNVVGATVSITNLIELLRRLRPDLSVRHTEQDIRTHL